MHISFARALSVSGGHKCHKQCYALALISFERNLNRKAAAHTAQQINKFVLTGSEESLPSGWLAIGMRIVAAFGT